MNVRKLLEILNKVENKFMPVLVGSSPASNLVEAEESVCMVQPDESEADETYKENYFMIAGPFEDQGKQDLFLETGVMPGKSKKKRKKSK